MLHNGQLLSDWIEDSIAPASYELRVGSWLDRQSRQAVPMNEGETYGLPPGGYTLLGVVEQVLDLPDDIVGKLYLRSTFGRRGFPDWQKGLVDPGYSGGLTIPLHNPSNRVIRIVGFERAVHITFERMSQPTARPYRGKYQHSSGPTASRYDDEIVMIGS